MKKIFIKIVKCINKLLYPRYDVENSPHSQITILKVAFFQKILGFNRNVLWPVHWTSTIGAPLNLVPGSRTPGLSKHCHIDGRNGIIFGENVWIGPHVKIISMNHDTNNYEKYIKTEPIKIGNDCWIGSGAIILPGVELGEHTIVGAGAVVTKSFLEENQVIGGNPAKVLKKLPKYGCSND